MNIVSARLHLLPQHLNHLPAWVALTTQGSAKGPPGELFGVWHWDANKVFFGSCGLFLTFWGRPLFMGEMFSWEVHDGVTYGWTQGFPSRQLPCNVTDVNHFTCQWFECCGSCSDCSDFCVNFKLMFSWYFRFCACLTCAVLIRLLEGSFLFFPFLYQILSDTGWVSTVYLCSCLELVKTVFCLK